MLDLTGPGPIVNRGKIGGWQAYLTASAMAATTVSTGTSPFRRWLHGVRMFDISASKDTINAYQ